MTRQRVTFYYDDEYDLGIHQLLVNVPAKRIGEGIRTAPNRALDGVPLAPAGSASPTYSTRSASQAECKCAAI